MQMLWQNRCLVVMCSCSNYFFTITGWLLIYNGREFTGGILNYFPVLKYEK